MRSPGSQHTCLKRFRWRMSMSGSVHRLIFTMPCWSCLQWGHFQASSGASWNQSVKWISQLNSYTNKLTRYLYYSTSWNTKCSKTWVDSDSNGFVLLLVCNYNNPVHHLVSQWTVEMVPTAITEICTFPLIRKVIMERQTPCCSNSSRRVATCISLNLKLLKCQLKWQQLHVMLAHVGHMLWKILNGS